MSVADYDKLLANLSFAADRWPAFAAAARDLGPLDVHAIPMQPSNRLLGVLTIHTAAGKPPAEGPKGRQFIANTVGASLLLDPETRARDDLRPDNRTPTRFFQLPGERRLIP